MTFFWTGAGPDKRYLKLQSKFYTRDRSGACMRTPQIETGDWIGSVEVSNCSGGQELSFGML